MTTSKETFLPCNVLQSAAIICASMLFLFHPCATAAGIGFYASGGYGQGAYLDDDASLPNLATLYYGRSHFGGGLVWDNNVAGTGVFNYRLNLGPELIQDIISNPAYDFTGVRFNWINDFGFAIIRAPGFRWWLGPQQGFFYVAESDESGSGILSLDFGLGAVNGFNFNLARNITLGLDFYLRYLFELATRIERSPAENFDAAYYGNGWESGLTFSFIVRGVSVHRRYRRY